MNKKMGLLGLLGLFVLVFSIYFSQWTPFAVLTAIGGGIVMGFSTLKLFH